MLEIQKPPRCVKFNTAKNVISRRNEAVTDKWNLQSDTPFFTKQRRKRGILSDRRLLCSSDFSFNHNGTVQHDSLTRREQARRRSSTSLGCILPPISLPAQKSVTRKCKRDISTERKQENSSETLNKLLFLRK